MTAAETRAQRQADRGRLLGIVADLYAHGGRVPCLDIDPHDRHLWTSEDDEDQSLAARMCVGCWAATSVTAIFVR